MTRQVFLRCPRLLSLGCDHGFGTRRSAGRVVPSSEWVRQVHGTRALRAPLVEPDAEADALFTDEPGLAVGVRTADCVPLLVAARAGDDSGRVVGVAAIHAGWKGSAAGVAERVVGQLAGTLACPASAMLIVVGPHVGPCCYEVDAPVVAAVREPGALSPAVRPDRFMLDLFALNRIQLVRAGVQPDAILRVPGCTHCDDRFESYRRDGSASGRMLHYVRMPVAASEARARMGA